MLETNNTTNIKNPQKFTFPTQEESQKPNQLDILNTIIKVRQNLLRDAPTNSCATITATQLLKWTNWIKKLPLDSSLNPLLIECLRKTPSESATLENLIRQMQSNGFSVNNPGDPFVIFNMMRSALLAHGQPSIQPLPILTAPCDNTECGYMQGDIEFTRDRYTGHLEHPHQFCARCGHGGMRKEVFLPEEFYVRISTLRFGDLDIPSIPKYPNYKVSIIIQKNKKKSHFRSLRIIGNQALLADNNWTIILEGKKDIKAAKQQDGWSPYIVMYSKHYSKIDEQYINQSIQVSNSHSNTPLYQPDPLITGGTSDQPPLPKPTKMEKMRIEIVHKQREELKQTIRLRKRIIELENICNDKETQILDLEEQIATKLDIITQMARQIQKLKEKTQRPQINSLQNSPPSLPYNNHPSSTHAISESIPQHETSLIERSYKTIQHTAQYQNHSTTQFSTQGKQAPMKSIWSTRKPTERQHSLSRDSKQNTIPANCCALTTIFDFLQKSQYLKNFQVLNNKIPEITSILSGNKRANYEQGIRRIIDHAKGMLNPIGKVQDPWLVLNTLCDLIETNSKPIPDLQLYPIIKCQCSRAQCAMVQTNLEYIRYKTKPYQILSLNCKKCNDNQASVPVWLPQQFFARLRDDQNATESSFSIPRIPTHRGYVTNAIVQYNKQRKHFRTIRQLGRDTTIILDGIESTDVSRFFV